MYKHTVSVASRSSGNDRRKSVCLSFCRNDARNSTALTPDGRAFHGSMSVQLTPGTLSPSVEVQRVAGTTIVIDTTEWRRRRACTSRTSCSDSARYTVAVLCRHRHTSHAESKLDPLWNLSQCSSWSNGVICGRISSQRIRKLWRHSWPIEARCVHLCRVAGNTVWSHMASDTP